MAKVLYCRDLGMDCDFVARGETDDEILRKAEEHAERVHGMSEVSPDMEDKILDNIHEDAERGTELEAERSEEYEADEEAERGIR
ncbi:MAG TPA: DUF1059 domain-containing protein [Gemmatimonadales bacterium]